MNWLKAWVRPALSAKHWDEQHRVNQRMQIMDVIDPRCHPPRDPPNFTTKNETQIWNFGGHRGKTPRSFDPDTRAPGVIEEFASFGPMMGTSRPKGDEWSHLWPGCQSDSRPGTRGSIPLHYHAALLLFELDCNSMGNHAVQQRRNRNGPK
jgi:hypothetical protein